MIQLFSTANHGKNNYDNDIFSVLDKYSIRWIFILLAYWNNSPQDDLSLQSDTFSRLPRVQAPDSFKYQRKTLTLQIRYDILNRVKMRHTKEIWTKNRLGGVMVDVIASSVDKCNWGRLRSWQTTEDVRVFSISIVWHIQDNCRKSIQHVYYYN
jgi:hypothetical protein